jgi:hypothetical protein
MARLRINGGITELFIKGGLVALEAIDSKATISC